MSDYTVSITISGYLVGNIWMRNAEVYKPFTHDVEGMNRRWGERGTLRDHVLAATNDGDFQSCRIADGLLAVTIRHHGKSSVTERCRYFDLSHFPSIADCIKEDWDGPCGDDW